MKKIETWSKNIVDENIKKIGDMFPNVLTETFDENENIVFGIDFELLKQELSSMIISDKKERYQLTWPGKTEANLSSKQSINKTLRPRVDSSNNFDLTENIYIEGDNLEALKLLRESYLNEIKLIYIDPPYNTGNDFIYHDNFSSKITDELVASGQTDSLGNRFQTNTDANGRFHSDWLTMMYPRLKVAKDLMAKDGLIFISIDDNEVDNLKKICNEVFGEKNLISVFIWNCSTAGGIRPKYVSKTHEYVLAYAKDIGNVPGFDAPLSKEAIKQYNKEDEKGIYREKDFVFRNNSTNINQKFLITCPDGELVKPKDGYIYRYIKETYEKAVKENVVVFKHTYNGPLITDQGKQAKWNIYIKKYLGDGTGAASSLLPKDLISIGVT